MQKKATADATAEAGKLRTELATVTARADAAAQTHATLTTSANERSAKLEIELKQVRKDAGQAREEAARLAGQVELLTAQAAERGKQEPPKN